jgi:hypothetical protein
VTGSKTALSRLWPILLVSALAVSGCTSTGSGLGDLGDSIGSNVGRSSDTYGTNRRPDVYGATTAPSLPSIGAPGLGK